MFDELEQMVGLINRHLEILQAVTQHEPVGIVKLSDKTGYPRPKVRYSLGMLQGAGQLKPTQSGARSTVGVEDMVTTHNRTVDALIDQVKSYGKMLEPSELSIEL